ncbi:hypothetical protein [Lentilactobacillus laojiaonis]|uniref:hypothetical protein n=1 Tax=Lentilactobacillus laojiaonis TaxID=2883998 RepID=UPI001D0AFC78|nr:hypothetical protein [Lentilactobacillus laojiaonis]UDM32483.1 hypothetical protein LHL71_01855 [Lentilactobacillus laojiaonis]
MNDKDGKPLTREAYRKKISQSDDKDFLERDKKRVQVEQEYAKEHGEQRRSWLRENPEDKFNFKSKKWKTTNSKLNAMLVILTVLIIIVYLVLFFVN